MKVALDAAGAPTIPPYHVIVDFGAGVPPDAQGRALLAFEKFLRIECGCPALVFKREMEDDLKRRRDMTPEERKSL